MNESAQMKSVALFYFFTLLDDSLAKQATLATIKRCQKKIDKFKYSDERRPEVVVNSTMDGWKKFNEFRHKGHSSISYEAGWQIPEGLDLGLWKDFHKTAVGEEFLSVVWSKLLKFSDKDIAAGLGVTQGTVRHRVARGVRLLGQLRNQ